MKQITVAILLLLCSTCAFADESGVLVVGVKPAPPFVEIDAQGRIEGFSVDLIAGLAGHLDPPRRVRFHTDPDIPSHLASLREGKADLGIAATTITADREQWLETSVPFYKADLAILVAVQESRMSIMMDFFTSKDFCLFLFSIFCFVFLTGNLIWFAEREDNFSKNYIRGVIQGMLWVVVTVTTVGYKDLYPKSAVGRLLAVLVMVLGIALFAISVAYLTSTLTVQQLRYAIAGPEDLYKHTVAVVEKTNTVTVLKRMGLGWKHQKPVKDLNQALEMLKSGQVQAVIHDRPMLQYLIRNEERGKFVILDQGFAPVYYGIFFPENSPLRKPFNLALLRAMEGGQDSYYYKLRRKWFGR
ncbi:ABC transporter substrate-binding protein [Desulfonema ishimotonii]|uniref:ABC transporter substrate-binding protein n=1 Tax=Desulfonema ishimotonii TaxID=45657 RepID=A0A401FWE0_9BACT|nr:transporter substrate-binding domain-containing protein [Desulfonema ishimotonii]GBC61263.1 ABC transporter substrate-binding protein [Desulfonema ishimotonii]